MTIKIHAKGDGMKTKIEVDGVLQKYVTAFTARQEVGRLPIVTLTYTPESLLFVGKDAALFREQMELE